MLQNLKNIFFATPFVYLNLMYFRPGTYQRWICESNKKGGSKKSVWFDSGNSVENSVGMEDADSGSEEEDDDLADLRLDTIRTSDDNDNTTPGAKRARYAEQKCYVCKDLLGADQSKRMGGLQMPVLYPLLPLLCFSLCCA